MSASSGDKTEKATAKRRRDEREQGHVLHSQDLSVSLLLLGSFFLLKLVGSYMGGGMMDVFRELLPGADLHHKTLTTYALQQYFIKAALLFARVVWPMALFALLATLLVNFIQTGFMFSGKSLGVKANRISPLAGAKRIFSSRAAMELLKSLLKIGLVIAMVWQRVYGDLRRLPSLMYQNVAAGMQMILNMLADMAIRCSSILLIIAALDYLYQWWKYEKDLRMTKQEVKDEYKLTEGDPQVKNRIRQKQRQMGMQRMMSDVAKADVVVTNPTHYAIALRYDSRKDAAPVVLARGKGFVARKIKEKAAQQGIMLVENRPLARALYAQCKIGRQIPVEFYQAVAEILTYVARMKGGRSR